MEFRRIHQLPLLCLLVFNLLATPAITSGYVWCVSADGHSVLEEALAGDCSLDVPAPPPDGLSTFLSDGPVDCGPCLDVSLAEQWGASRSRQDDIPGGSRENFFPVAVAANLSLPERFLNKQQRFVDPAPRIPDPIRYHRTTVLLI